MSLECRIQHRSRRFKSPSWIAQHSFHKFFYSICRSSLYCRTKEAFLLIWDSCSHQSSCKNLTSAINVKFYCYGIENSGKPTIVCKKIKSFRRNFVNCHAINIAIIIRWLINRFHFNKLMFLQIAQASHEIIMIRRRVESFSSIRSKSLLKHLYIEVMRVSVLQCTKLYALNFSIHKNPQIEMAY